MKNSLTLLFGLIVAVVLLLYMFLFTVRYDEVVVLTTFKEAIDPVYNDAGELVDAGSVKRDPRLYFRWPWPVQEVHAYPTRLQVLEDQFEEFQTADGSNLIIRAYLVWRIEDPLAFFRRLQAIERAETQLNALLRDTKGIMSRYRFDQLVNTDPSQLKLDEIEQQMRQEIRDRLASTGYGIAVEQVGIRRMVLPEDVTEDVFERMKSRRQRLAEKARAEGLAQAAAIKSEANSASKRIMAFAEQRALAIRAEGDARAAQYYDVFKQDEQFAVELRRIETLKAVLPRSTVIMPADQIVPGGGLIKPNE